jgi:hypothetical protein
MKTNRLLIAAVLAIAIGAPIVGFVGDINMAQPTTPADERAAFLHGPANGPIANQSGLANPDSMIHDVVRDRSPQAELWTIKRDAAEFNKPNGRIAYRFHARDLNLVMGPMAPGTSVKFRDVRTNKFWSGPFYQRH